jgi:5-methylcytosine-specific restriction endonuclease McrA
VIRPLILSLLLLASAADAATQRDRNQVNAFKREHPCPVTGKVYGACRGWEVDHKVPLKCGGADHPSNMQWLTRGQHKRKTAREAKLCLKPR